MSTLTKPALEVAPAKVAAETPPGSASATAGTPAAVAVELGGRKGPEPTRFGDWEKSGRCIDF
jgi:hypothetical protein